MFIERNMPKGPRSSGAQCAGSVDLLDLPIQQEPPGDGRAGGVGVVILTGNNFAHPLFRSRGAQCVDFILKPA